MRIDFESKPVYGDNDKYIKTDENMRATWLQIFIIKKCQKKKYHASLYQ